MTQEQLQLTYPSSFDSEYMKDYKLWKPLIGELVFNEDLGLARVIEYKDDIGYNLEPIGITIKELLICSYWCKLEYIEPFIGDLPSNLKRRINDNHTS